MSLITWEDKYSVKVPRLDKQHQQLFSLINQLHDAMRMGQANEVMSRILGELIAYTKNHFAAEEQMLQSSSYPDLKAHQAQHREFTDKMLSFQKELGAGKMTLSIDVMRYLRDWLSNHIMKTDKLYSEFLGPKP